MGGAPYIGPRLGGGPILEVQKQKSAQVSYPRYLHNSNDTTIDFNLIQLIQAWLPWPIKSEGSRLSGQYFTVYH